MAELDDLKDKFRNLLETRVQRDADAAKAKRSEITYRETEAELFAELEDAGIRGRLEFDFGGDLGVAKFQRRHTQYGRVLNKAALIESLKKEGLDDVLVSEGISQARLNELVRDRLESKADIPEGADFYDRNQISISRK